MTIARVAQDKFEYQDLTSLLFVLEGLDDPSIVVRSEPAVGEDTEVEATIGGKSHTFDIQSKDEPAAFAAPTALNTAVQSRNNLKNRHSQIIDARVCGSFRLFLEPRGEGSGGR